MIKTKQATAEFFLEIKSSPLYASRKLVRWIGTDRQTKKKVLFHIKDDSESIDIMDGKKLIETIHLHGFQSPQRFEGYDVAYLVKAEKKKEKEKEMSTEYLKLTA